jgi:formate hydrogenlyase subunit 3/multisubunit Na+/H+ antiporter MnhD subunit
MDQPRGRPITALVASGVVVAAGALFGALAGRNLGPVVIHLRAEHLTGGLALIGGLLTTLACRYAVGRREVEARDRNIRDHCELRLARLTEGSAPSVRRAGDPDPAGGLYSSNG